MVAARGGEGSVAAGVGSAHLYTRRDAQFLGLCLHPAQVRGGGGAVGPACRQCTELGREALRAELCLPGSQGTSLTVDCSRALL